MPRRPRVHIAGGCYHVTLRGNHRRDIFRDAADRSALDSIVRGASERTGARVLAYCWMSNHIHLVIEVAVQPLGKLMHRVGTRYARYVQRGTTTTGHLFERRYHAVVINRQDQLPHVIRYVHFNPVRAGLVAAPADYPWSSHRQYLGARDSSWVFPAIVLGGLAAEPDEARRAFAEFCGEALQAPQCMEAARQVLGYRSAADRPDLLAARLTGTLDRIIADVCRWNGVSEQQLAAPGKNHLLAGLRGEIASRAVADGGITLSDVARRFHRDISTVARSAARWQQLQRKLPNAKPGTSEKV